MTVLTHEAQEAQRKLAVVFAEAGDDLDINLVTSLSGTYAEKCAEIKRLSAKVESGKIETKGRALAARAGGWGSGESNPSGSELGKSILQAVEDVHAGRVATSYVDPFSGQATDLVSHERNAFDMQASGGAGGPGLSASWTDSGPAGGMVPVDLRQPFFTLRAASVVMNLPGINIVQLRSDRGRFPRISGVQADGSDLTQVGVQESTTIAETTPDVDMVDVVPIKFAVYHTFSSEFYEDASADALALLTNNAMKQLGLKVDLSMLQGLGGSDLVGLRNTPGISTTSVAATPASFDKITDTVYAAEAANADPNALIMNPRSWQTFSKIKTGLAGDQTTLLEPDPEITALTLLGLPVFKSTQITLTEGGGAGSWVAAVDARQLLVAIRRTPLIEVSKDPQFQQDNIALKITARYGFAVLNPQGVSIATDVR